MKRYMARVLGTSSFVVALSSIVIAQNATAAVSTVSSLGSNNAPKYVQGEVLVKFKTPPAGVQALSASTMLNQTVLGKVSTKDYTLLNTTLVTSKTKSTQELVDELKQNTQVKMVAPNYIRTLSATNDPHYNLLWGIENTGQTINSVAGTPDADMDANEAWTLEKGSSSVIVAVLDTGVDYTHPDLAGNMWNGLPNHGYDFASDANGSNDDDPMPSHWHGTHVAGTIGAVGDNSEGISGVAQHVSIMALKVFRPDNYAYDSDILEAMEFVLQKIDEGENIVAINASYGGSGYNPIVLDTINMLGDKGVVFCAAAANSRTNIDIRPSYPAAYNAKSIMSIAASNQQDGLASFSNYGKLGVDIAAPGVNIYSTLPDNAYGYANGTSMAAPHVVGAIALYATRYPDSSVAQRKRALMAYSDVKEALMGKVASAGRVNIFKALQHDPDILNPIDDTYVTRFETAITMDVLANDMAKDIDAMVISSVTVPSNGTATVDSNGTLTYAPNSGFSGSDSFEYMVSDGIATESATVSVLVKKEALHIADSVLAECIRKELGVGSVSDITEDLAPSLTRLSCAGVSDLNGVEHFTNIEYIELSRSTITSIAPLSSLTKVTKARFTLDKLSDISALENFTNLQELTLGSGVFSDVAPLANLTKLTRLVVNNTKLQDISALSGLSQLTALDLSKNAIDDISTLGMLPNISTLNLSHNNIGDISALNILNNVWSISLIDNSIVDVSPLANVVIRSSLLVRGNKICDFTSLEHLGTRLSGLNQQDRAACYSSVTTYEDGQNGTIAGWRVYDGDPDGAQVFNVYDRYKESYIIDFYSVARPTTKNGYILGAQSGADAWNNTTERIIEWSMQYSKDYVVYISVQTTKGHRYLYYSAANSDSGLHSNGTYIHHGLGSISKNRTWQTFTRDLDADLAEFEPDNAIISVNAFLIRGAGKVDNIRLKKKHLAVYEDADGYATNALYYNINGWRVYDNDPSGATIINDYNSETNRAIVFNGEGAKNGYILGNQNPDNASAWNNLNDRTVHWNMNFSEAYTVYISVQTTKGHRYLYYSATNSDLGLHSNGTYIHHGLGNTSIDGMWQTFSRNLSTDLKEFEPDNEILSVNAFLIRGSGKINKIWMTE